MHILIAHDDDLETIDEVIAKKSTTPWIVPKSAQIGDDCAFAHGGIGIAALATIKTAPELVKEGHWKGRYSAVVGDVKALADPIGFEALVEMFPTWKWPTYPRMYTTPPEAIASELLSSARDATHERSVDVDAVLTFEGAPRLRAHLARERDRTIVIAKISAVLRDKKVLACECCSFDFQRTYGNLGQGFCEVHHLYPIGERTENEVTRLEDLAIVCSNCHRMLHRKTGLTVEMLQSVIRKNTA